MRISELCSRSGIPPATVKYYLREGLLAPGTPLTPRLADYDETHLRRLRLLRVLREVGEIPITRLRDLVDAVESTESLHRVFAAAADALAPAPPPGGEHRALAQEHADRLIEQAGWQVRPTAADRHNLGAVLETFISIAGHLPEDTVLQRYVDAAETIGATEIESLRQGAHRARLLEQMVIGQVLFGRLLAVLRRLSEEHHSAARFDDVT